MSKSFKFTSCQSWRSQEKVCHPAPAPLEPVGPGLIIIGVVSFSKFNGRYLYSPSVCKKVQLRVDFAWGQTILKVRQLQWSAIENTRGRTILKV